MKAALGYCDHCGRDVLLRTPWINYIFQLLMTVVTFGFWLIVWYFMGQGTFRCPRCGGKMLGSALHR